jgi:hypothetical protein
MRRWGAVGLAIAAVTATPVAAQVQRPPSEMQGGCDNFQWDLKREFALFRNDPVALVAAIREDSATAAAPLDRPIKVRLQPQRAVSFRVPPERLREGEGQQRYAGLLRFTAPRPGLYRITVESGQLWVDVVAGNELVKSPAYEAQTQCRPIVKSIAYRLTAGPLLVQMNGIAASETTILITAVDEGR